jgi:DNA mismatch repair protein MutL
MQRRKIEKIRQAEKIAAGEVVERPANIVKELVENSIDAGAKEIRVIVKRAGKNLVQVIDDGIGIPPDEIEFAFEHHTSSKIRSIEDLDTLSTLGFRGEALTSIAAISQVEIISRIAEKDLGMLLNIEGGKLVDKREVSCPIGTDIKIKNIFYNIPARQKFLKSDQTELGHITDFIQRYALAYPNLHFIYRHKDLDILNCPASNDLKTTVFHIYGKKVAKFMEVIEFKEDQGKYNVYGLLGHPQIAKKNRSFSSIFINQRYIISDVLFRAVKEAYEGTLMVGKYPFIILFLEIDPSIIDFNVHPKKLHVRFEDEEYVYNKFYNIIRKFIEEKFIAKEAKYIETELGEFISPVDRPSIDEDLPLSAIEPEVAVEVSREIEPFIEEPVQLNLMEQIVKSKIGKERVPESLLRERYINIENFPKLRLISSTGQLSNNIYILLEGVNEQGVAGIYILDQHAASERINKEYFIDMFESSKTSKQQLISPLKVEVSPSEKFFLEENLKEIKKLGFNFDQFGGNTFILRDIPTIMGKIPNVDIIKEIISDITEIGKDKSFSEIKEQIINYIACHKSIRGGDVLTLKDIRKLLINLANCKDSYHCAHGRPTLRFISFKELDKMFKRIV